IIDDIASSGLSEGDLLPTIKELASRYNVSETPIRKALKKLGENNFLETVRGSGIFLKNSVPKSLRMEQDANLFSDISVPFVQNEHISTHYLTLAIVDKAPLYQKLWNEIIRRFEVRNPHIKIIQITDKNYDFKKVDIFQLDHRNIIDYVNNNNLAPLDTNLIIKEKFPDEVFSPASKKNKIYGLPLTLTFPLQLLNINMLHNFIPDYSITDYDFSTFIEVLEKFCKIQETEHNIFLSLGSCVNPFMYLMAFSDKFFDYSACVIKWKHPDILRFLYSIEKIKRPAQEIGMESSVILKNFFDEKVFCLSTFSPVIRNFYTNIPSFVQARPFPSTASGKVLYGCNYIVVGKHSKNYENTMKFISFLLTEEITKLTLEHGLFHVLAANVKHDGDVIFNQEREMLKHSLPCSIFGAKNYDFIIKSFYPVIDMVREGRISAKDAIAILTKEYKCSGVL
ncbi:MAG: GntR family transcriptional regulator, partial [Candidatus Uhrbacteria bacterium GW2011_GWF2_39_13]